MLHEAEMHLREEQKGPLISSAPNNVTGECRAAFANAPGSVGRPRQQCYGKIVVSNHTVQVQTLIARKSVWRKARMGSTILISIFFKPNIVVAQKSLAPSPYLLIASIV